MAKDEKPKAAAAAPKKKQNNRWNKYEKSGSELKRKNKFCPKCGEGIFLAKHKNRETCGKCGYTNFSSK